MKNLFFWSPSQEGLWRRAYSLAGEAVRVHIDSNELIEGFVMSVMRKVLSGRSVSCGKRDN